VPGIMVRSQNILILPPDHAASDDSGSDSDEPPPAAAPAVRPSPVPSEESVNSDAWSDDPGADEDVVEEFAETLHVSDRPTSGWPMEQAIAYVEQASTASMPVDASPTVAPAVMPALWSTDAAAALSIASDHLMQTDTGDQSFLQGGKDLARLMPRLCSQRISTAPAVSDDVEPRRWDARPCDKCARCGQLGHWASECTAMVCGNCNTVGHLARDCPKPAPCFRCGQLGHWSKQCPQRHTKAQPAAPANVERRWVLFQHPTIKRYRHHCNECSYMTTVLTKASHSMPRHKEKGIGRDGSKWCEGSGQKPSLSELLSERPDPNVYGCQEPLGEYDAILDWNVPRHAPEAKRSTRL
jgi:hypothetical protein